MTISRKIANKKTMTISVILGAGILLSAIFVASPLTLTWAQQQMAANNSGSNPPYGYMNQFSNPIPKINGSVNIVENIKNVFKENTKTSFTAASETAQKQVPNGTILGGHLGVTQGYLVYTFFGVNPGTHTTYFTIIDAGNGKVLYTSPAQQMSGGGFFGRPGALGGAFGPLGGPHGLAGGFGHGPFGFGHGPGGAQGGFMGGDGIWR
jgi:uncharacterized membrane protein YkoI